MINWSRRTIIFALFVLSDYLRSWRFLAESLVGFAVYGLFLFPQGADPLDAARFFSVSGLFMLVQAAYSTWIIVGLGRRAQGYVILSRPLGRSGYLIGHYLASVAWTVTLYTGLSLVVFAVYLAGKTPIGFSLESWLLGVLPLALDAAVVAAYVTLVTPLVLTSWLRLLALALLALALSTEVGVFNSLEMGWILVRLHEVMGFFLLPVAAGFGLAVQRSYTLASGWIFGSQLLSVLLLLVLAVIAFGRRETILTS